ncbi:plasmid mobilization protein [Mycobacterium paragordonae]
MTTRSEKRQRTVIRACRMTPEEKRSVTAAAKAAGVSVSKFVRDAALHRADQVNDAATLLRQSGAERMK